MDIKIRLSHSYPPTYAENNQYLAQVHSIINQFRIQIDQSKIYLQPFISTEQIGEIRLLHKEWFPLEYSDTFYNGLTQNYGNKSILALYNFEHEDKTYKLILGCITYEYRFLDQHLIRFSCSDILVDKYGVYILTFGVINEVRSQGVGTMLLNKLFELSKEENNIKCFYLDVVAYNVPGQRCYERNGFIKVRTKKEYYNIFQKRYDAYVYCRYVNGGKRPRTTKEILYSCVSLCNLPSKMFCKMKNKVKKMCEYRHRSAKYKELKV